MPHPLPVETNGHDDPDVLYRHLAGLSGLLQLRCVLVATSGLLRLWRDLQGRHAALAERRESPASHLDWLFGVTRNDPPSKLRQKLAEAPQQEREARKLVDVVRELRRAGPDSVALWRAEALSWAFVHVFRGVPGTLREDGSWFGPKDADLPHYAGGHGTPRPQAAHELALAVENALQAMIGPLATTVERPMLEAARAHWLRSCRIGAGNPNPSA